LNWRSAHGTSSVRSSDATHGSELEQVVIAVGVIERLAFLILAIPIIVVEVVVGGVIPPACLALLLW
jgi:hypothetical protein